MDDVGGALRSLQDQIDNFVKIQRLQQEYTAECATGSLMALKAALHAVDADGSAVARLRPALRSYLASISEIERQRARYGMLEAFLGMLDQPNPGGSATIVPLKPKG